MCGVDSAQNSDIGMHSRGCQLGACCQLYCTVESAIVEELQRSSAQGV
jgi:hypothetical protein